MKVLKTKATDSVLSSTIDLEAAVPKNVAEDLKRDVGDFLVEQILSSVGSSESPITGSKFKALSKEYKKHKEDQGLGNKPNLEFSGSMLDSLDYKITPKGIEIGIFGEDAPKADGHNNFSGDSKLPTRQFLPKEGDGFSSKIQSGVDQIINEYLVKANPLKEEDIKQIESKSDLWDLLENQYEDLTKAEIRDAVLGNMELVDLLNEYGLLKYLGG
jgi:hypothetical protein